MGFHEDWYPDPQLRHLLRLCRHVRDLPGAMIEIGCWEGKSTVALANTCHPETLIAVDSWTGNIAEDPNHYHLQLLAERDVYGTFVKNINELTRGNVQIVKQDCFEFLASFSGPVKFCHIDASHDYASVKRTIEMLKPMMIDGGILCGDDYLNAGRDRLDLDGGVERACFDALPAHYVIGNFWFWRNDEVSGRRRASAA